MSIFKQSVKKWETFPTYGNFCSSCQAKRSVLFAANPTAKALEPFPQSHWAFHIPRGAFERDRELLGLQSQATYDAILTTSRALCN